MCPHRQTLSHHPQFFLSLTTNEWQIFTSAYSATDPVSPDVAFLGPCVILILTLVAWTMTPHPSFFERVNSLHCYKTSSVLLRTCKPWNSQHMWKTLRSDEEVHNKSEGPLRRSHFWCQTVSPPTSVAESAGMTMHVPTGSPSCACLNIPLLAKWRICLGQTGCSHFYASVAARSTHYTYSPGFPLSERL